MARTLIQFVDPKTSTALLVLDNGTRINGVDVVHQNRDAKSFSVPDSAPDGNGCRLIFTAEGRVTSDQRGILWFEDDTAWLQMDDHYLQPVPPPVIIVEPCPDPEPPPTDDPFEIIKHIYATGDYDLSTKEGCGIFTEDCCDRLHDMSSNRWGYIKITPPQNGYNGHRLDKLQVLVNVTGAQAGVYDIIFDSESPSAEPAFNFQGAPIPSLWYYPA
jgi:hypothetical protein